MQKSEGITSHKHAIQSPPVDLSTPLDNSSLDGKTALVTGGASGTGESCAIELAKHGVNIIVADSNASRGAAVVARLRSSSKNSDHHFVHVDVVDWVSQVACFQQAARLSPHGGIDIVVAGAGINDPSENEVFQINVPSYTKLARPPAPSLKTLRVDLEGVLYTSTLALSYLSENPGSEACAVRHSKSSVRSRDRHLILVSSIAGVLAMPANGVYTAAKHGVVGMFRSLRLTAPLLQGVRVNMICPYYVDTPILDARGHIPMLGVAMTKIERVTEALMRLRADDEIIGRALVIGPDGTEAQIKEAGLNDIAGTRRHADGAIVDLHGHDFEQTDLLMMRVMGLMNLVTAARGWTGLIYDVGLRLAQASRRFMPF